MPTNISCKITWWFDIILAFCGVLTFYEIHIIWLYSKPMIRRNVEKHTIRTIFSWENVTLSLEIMQSTRFQYSKSLLPMSVKVLCQTFMDVPNKEYLPIYCIQHLEKTCIIHVILGTLSGHCRVLYSVENRPKIEYSI